MEDQNQKNLNDPEKIIGIASARNMEELDEIIGKAKKYLFDRLGIEESSVSSATYLNPVWGITLAFSVPVGKEMWHAEAYVVVSGTDKKIVAYSGGQFTFCDISKIANSN